MRRATTAFWTLADDLDAQRIDRAPYGGRIDQLVAIGINRGAAAVQLGAANHKCAALSCCCCLVEAPADRRRLAAYNYMEVAKLTASDAAAGDYFGRSVAIDGDTVVVGAPPAGTGGAVYVFRTSDGGATYARWPS